MDNRWSSTEDPEEKTEAEKVSGTIQAELSESELSWAEKIDLLNDILDTMHE